MTGADEQPRLVVISSVSGAGRTTFLNALEDIGFLTYDNLPAALIPSLLSEEPQLDKCDIAIGLDTRSFTNTAKQISLLKALPSYLQRSIHHVFLDCDEDILQRRYNVNRRRHPLPGNQVLSSIMNERLSLAPYLELADWRLNTSALSANKLKQIVSAHFLPETSKLPLLTLQSFSYKHGLPRDADVVIDVRFLRNPYYSAPLQNKNGQDADVQAYIKEDPQYAPFVEKFKSLWAVLLAGYQQEGKSYLTLAFGCTGGQHRSVTVVEELADWLEREGWSVTKLHREL